MRLEKTQRLVAGIALLMIILIAVSSSTVVTVKQFVQIVSNITGGRISESEFRAFWESSWWIFVKGWHATEFGLLYWFLSTVLSRRKNIAIILTMAFALADEIHQVSVAARGGRLSDVVIDCLGIAVAFIIQEWILSRRVPTLPTTSKISQVIFSVPGWMVYATVLFFLCLYFLSHYPFGSLEPLFLRRPV